MIKLQQELEALLGVDNVLTDDASCDFFAQDIFTRGLKAGAIIRPNSVDHLAKSVGLVTRNGHAIIPRGGGMSYTKGYVPKQPHSVIVDMTCLDQIVEINTTDMFVTVEGGVTWDQLYSALSGTGFRTPFWGPFSGSRATIGAGLSQQTIFWGAGHYGCSADSVTSLDVVLANGNVLSTGTAAQVNGSPFYRHFGPDLTGLFLNDTGAMGIKARVTLRLMPDTHRHGYLSFDFETIDDQMCALSDIARSELASEMFGLDPVMANLRAERDRVVNDVKRLGQVIRKSGVGAAAKLAASGRKGLKSLNYPVHIIVEDLTDAGVKHRLERITDIARQSSGRELDASIPTVIRASPFAPLNNVVGPKGERWVPVNALVPHSKASACISNILSILEKHRIGLEAHSVQTGMMTGAVSTNCVFIEPTFYWPDERYPLHKATVEKAVQRKFDNFPASPEAWQLIHDIRLELSQAFSDIGASHLQLGKTYHYSNALKPEALNLVVKLKQIVDPKGLMNPGSLGL